MQSGSRIAARDAPPRVCRRGFPCALRSAPVNANQVEEPITQEVEKPAQPQVEKDASTPSKKPVVQQSQTDPKDADPKNEKPSQVLEPPKNGLNQEQGETVVIEQVEYFQKIPALRIVRKDHEVSLTQLCQLGPAKHLTIAAPNGGRLIGDDIPGPGDRVKKGQVLARIDVTELYEERDQLRDKLELAKLKASAAKSRLKVAEATLAGERAACQRSRRQSPTGFNQPQDRQ